MGVKAVSLFCLFLILGCDTDIQHNSDRVDMRHVDGRHSQMIVENSPRIPLRFGYSIQPIAAQSRWRVVGTIQQGQLLKPVDQVLQVDAGHKYEGYLVVNQQSAVGVYLPVESAFITADKPTPITLKEVTP